MVMTQKNCPCMKTWLSQKKFLNVFFENVVPVFVKLSMTILVHTIDLSGQWIYLDHNRHLIIIGDD